MIFPWTSTRRRTNSSIKDWEKFPPSSAVGSQVLGGKVEGGATGAGDEDEERKRRLWVVGDEETESCPGCSQMPGTSWWGWAHLSLALPVSLACCGEKATDGVQKDLLRSLLSFLLLQSWGAAPGKHGDHGWPRPSITAGVNCLQRGLDLLPRPPTKTLLPPCGCKQELHVCPEFMGYKRKCSFLWHIVL